MFAACDGGGGGATSSPLCPNELSSTSFACPDGGFDAATRDVATADTAAVDAALPEASSVDAAMNFPVLPTCTGIFGIDTTFGTQGIVTDSTEANQEPFSIAVQADGKVLVGGDAYLARYGTTGAIDTTFGVNGYLSFPTETVAESILPQADGTIVIAGADPSESCLLERFTAVGAVDTTFGTNGRAVCADGSPSFEQTVQRANGSFVAAGTGYPGAPGIRDFGVAQLTSSGAVDATFGKAGVAYAGFPGDAAGTALALQADGKIVVVGEVTVARGAMPSQVGVVRFLANGALDTAFGTGGRAVFTIPHLEGGTARVALQSTGAIVITGQGAPTDTNFTIARLTPDGQLDPTFGTAGLATVAFSGSHAFGVALNVMGGDVLLVGGEYHVGDSAELGFARFSANGALDGAFGTAGTYVTDFPDETEGTYFAAQALLSNGGLVVVSDGTHLDGDGNVFEESVITRYACH